jgi:hypothetical protein
MPPIRLTQMVLAREDKLTQMVLAREDKHTDRMERMLVSQSATLRDLQIQDKIVIWPAFG